MVVESLWEATVRLEDNRIVAVVVGIALGVDHIHENHDVTEAREGLLHMCVHCYRALLPTLDHPQWPLDDNVKTNYVLAPNLHGRPVG